MAAIISLQNVTFTYAIANSPALRNVSLDVPAGQICGVVGRAGAGKTTLCALCAGFIPNFYDGRINGGAMVDGQDVIQHPVAELVRHVGLVNSNSFSQISGARFSVYEEVGFGLENLGLPYEEMVERIAWALDALQLGELRDRSPYGLSGGQQQRMVIAATLAMRPPVLVLDEPTAQLDPPATEHLADILRDLAHQGTTILFAEHRLDWTAGLADRVVVLDGGQIIAEGQPETTLTDPLLLDRQIGWPRAAALAAAAREQGRWPTGRPLPSTLDGLVAGLRAVDDRRGGTIYRAPTNDGAETPHAPRPAPRAPIVALEDVHFTYPGGVEALRGVSVAVGVGERVALLGRNGAGKSTLVRHLNGLLRPTAGRALVSGTETSKTTVAKCARQVGIVFQDIRNQLFARTVRDELAFGPRNLGYSPARIDALVDRALRVLKLQDAANEHPYDLPPAWRRLVAIAAVLAMDSALLVLDEPTAGLDSASIALLTALAHDLAAQGKSVLVVSHDLDFCFEALDRVILLREGHVVLDSAWGALDDAALAALDAEVGLPLSLRAASALDLSPDSELRALLVSRERFSPITSIPQQT
ncbi:MAG TPA: energy-coupling factor transporter ATPase [Roseiflexaceae bacterium]